MEISNLKRWFSRMASKRSPSLRILKLFLGRKMQLKINLQVSLPGYRFYDQPRLL